MIFAVKLYCAFSKHPCIDFSYIFDVKLTLLNANMFHFSADLSAENVVLVALKISAHSAFLLNFGNTLSLHVLNSHPPQNSPKFQILPEKL